MDLTFRPKGIFFVYLKDTGIFWVAEIQCFFGGEDCTFHQLKPTIRQAEFTVGVGFFLGYAKKKVGIFLS